MLKPGDAAGWKANGGNGHCLINRIAARRGLSRDRHAARRPRRAVYSDIDMRLERDKTRRALSAQDRRAVSGAEGVERRCRRSIARQFRGPTMRPIRRNSPPPIAGREKQKLGDAVGPDAVRRQHRAHQGAFDVGAAPLARERGRIHLHAGRRAGAARERRRDRAQAGRRRRLARQRRHRPLPDQPHRPRRALSRSRHALEERARALSRRRFPHGARRQGPPLDAQVRRADQGMVASEALATMGESGNRRPRWPTRTSSSTSTPTASRSSPGTCPGAR